MTEKLFEDFGCEIIKRDEKLFVRCDSGESAGGQYLEYEISSEEAKKVMRSEMDAYEIILKKQNEN